MLQLHWSDKCTEFYTKINMYIILLIDSLVKNINMFYELKNILLWNNYLDSSLIHCTARTGSPATPSWSFPVRSSCLSVWSWSWKIKIFSLNLVKMEPLEENFLAKIVKTFTSTTDQAYKIPKVYPLHFQSNTLKKLYINFKCSKHFCHPFWKYLKTKR